VNFWKSLLFCLMVVASSILPIGIAVLTGLVVGSIPEAVMGGFQSPTGETTLNLLAALALLILLLRVLFPLQAALAASLGRYADRFLQELVMAAVGRLLTGAEGVELRSHD
jgi:ATP-binding cassette, subfamily B, bacterial